MTKCLSAAFLAATVALAASNAGADPVDGAPSARLLIIPFTALNVPDGQQWIAKGVQENLVADFGRTPGYSPVAFQGQVVVEDNATATRLAKQAAASLVIRGATQIVGSTVRITAQLINAKSGDTLSTASVTGPASDLLKMEDDLSAQLRGAGQAVAAGAAGAATQPAAQPPAQPQIILIMQPPATPNFDTLYPNNYYNPWPGYYPIAPILISNPIPPHRHHGGHGDERDPPAPVVPITPPHPIHALPVSTGATLTSGVGFLPLPTNSATLPLPTNIILPLPADNGLLSPLPQTGFSSPGFSRGAPISSVPRLQEAPVRSFSGGGRAQFVSYR